VGSWRHRDRLPQSDGVPMSSSYTVPGMIVNSITHTGSTVGFYGTTPAVQSGAMTDAAEGIDVSGADSVNIAMLNVLLNDHAARLNALVDALQAQGLMATS